MGKACILQVLLLQPSRSFVYVLCNCDSQSHLQLLQVGDRVLKIGFVTEGHKKGCSYETLTTFFIFSGILSNLKNFAIKLNIKLQKIAITTFFL